MHGNNMSNMTNINTQTQKGNHVKQLSKTLIKNEILKNTDRSVFLKNNQKIITSNVNTTREKINKISTSIDRNVSPGYSKVLMPSPRDNNISQNKFNFPSNLNTMQSITSLFQKKLSNG